MGRVGFQLAISALFVAANVVGAADKGTKPPVLIPAPKTVTWIQRGLVLRDSAKIVVPENASPDVWMAANGLARAIQEVAGKKIAIVRGRVEKERAGSIFLRPGLKDAELGPEGYALSVDRGVVLQAADGRGLFYAAQTLRQLLHKGNKVILAGCKIRDWPAWSYRGLQIDPARNYMASAFLKQQIDFISAYKLNHLHLHLTDDEGWRLEIKAYPNLASEKKYTQAEMKDLIAYARERFVTIVPEIEMPGHAIAFGREFPDLYHRVGSALDSMCIGNEKTYQVAEQIWKEAAAVFDSPYMHVGGDETNDVLECPLCRAKWEEVSKGPNPPGSLVAYFLARMNGIIKAQGKQAIAWTQDNRHWKGTLPKDMIGMSWTTPAVDYARQGCPVIDAYVRPLYFDHRHGIPAFLKWRPNDGVSEPLPTLLGAEGQVWYGGGEKPFVEEEFYRDGGFFPRLLVFADRVWGPPPGDPYADPALFEQRALDHKARFFSGFPFPYPPESRDPNAPYPW
jgi:hexosaminidase